MGIISKENPQVILPKFLRVHLEGLSAADSDDVDRKGQFIQISKTGMHIQFLKKYNDPSKKSIVLQEDDDKRAELDDAWIRIFNDINNEPT